MLRPDTPTQHRFARLPSPGAPSGSPSGSDGACPAGAILPVGRADLMGSSDSSAFLLRNLLSSEECDDIIAQAEAFGLSDVGYLRRIRVNDRVKVMGEDLSELLMSRARPHLDDMLLETPTQARAQAARRPPKGLPKGLLRGLWTPESLNPCFRVCRYGPGGFFLPHHDEGPDLHDKHRSIKTFMVYLNDDFAGGPTNFYAEDQGLYMKPDPGKVICELRPEKGSCVVFNHCITHDGGELLAGRKYILRTEVLYRHHSTIAGGATGDSGSDSDFECSGQGLASDSDDGDAAQSSDGHE
mmetsp:Transcript_21139/g.59423  ORF Transcript_21139/g.59423 Transcript_21139/m.59423 type:complete len:298 (-) Transcript_21139:250-1143(-)